MSEPDSRGAAPSGLLSAAAEVVRVSVPLMISAGMLSVVLFVDRTLLMHYDGASMSASMAGGNLYWVLVCVPIGAAAMTSATIGQLIGNDERHKVGRLLWQTMWLALMTCPWFVVTAFYAEVFVSLVRPTTRTHRVRIGLPSLADARRTRFGCRIGTQWFLQWNRTNVGRDVGFGRKWPTQRRTRRFADLWGRGLSRVGYHRCRHRKRPRVLVQSRLLRMAVAQAAVRIDLQDSRGVRLRCLRQC